MATDNTPKTPPVYTVPDVSATAGAPISPIDPRFLDPLVLPDFMIKKETALDLRITKLAFMNRFTNAEAIAIDLASQGSTPQAAGVRVYKDKLSVSTYIDLGRIDLQEAVNSMETSGLLAKGRATEILSKNITDQERYVA